MKLAFYKLNPGPGEKFMELPFASGSGKRAEALKIFISLKNAGNMALPEVKNRELFFNELFHSLGLEAEEHTIHSLKQVHSREVLAAGAGFDAGNGNREADGLVSADRRAVLCLTVADCLPIVLADGKTGGFGIVHSGWKGTGIVLRALDMMENDLGSRFSDIRIFIGPGIGPCCYRVDEERYLDFKANFGAASVARREDEYFIDLRKANIALLKNRGIRYIDIVENCTSCTPELHSFRRDGKKDFGVALICAGYFNKRDRRGE